MSIVQMQLAYFMAPNCWFLLQLKSFHLHLNFPSAVDQSAPAASLLYIITKGYNK